MIIRLIESLRALAASANIQLALPEFVQPGDEPARAFGDAFLLVCDCPQIRLTAGQLRTLGELELQLDKMGAELWTPHAVRAATEWDEVRERARRALQELGEARHTDVRPFDAPADYYGMIEYFHSQSDDAYLRMGVDRQKLPARDQWFERSWRDHKLAEDDPRRDRFFLAWVFDGGVVGHSSINQIIWGKQANAHLHLWRSDLRQAGIGAEFFRRSISIYFTRFKLHTINVEPHAKNLAPNRVLEKLGFRFVKQYRTVPGPVNFEQDVNHYEIDRATWELNNPWPQ